MELNNSWNLAVTANTADFLSLLESAAKAPRKPDGSLPDVFARLVSGSDLIDKGANVGLPFNGTAPDLGAFEFGPQKERRTPIRLVSRKWDRNKPRRCSALRFICRGSNASPVPARARTVTRA